MNEECKHESWWIKRDNLGGWECIGCSVTMTEAEMVLYKELLAIKKMLIEQPARIVDSPL